jgi:hypothetical protein
MLEFQVFSQFWVFTWNYFCLFIESLQGLYKNNCTIIFLYFVYLTAHRVNVSSICLTAEIQYSMIFVILFFT